MTDLEGAHARGLIVADLRIETSMDDTTDRLLALERRVSLLEIRARVLHPVDNRRILEVFAKFAASPFNDGSLTLTPDAICHATGLGTRDLALALGELRAAGFVELVKVDGMGHWRITEDGMQANPQQ